MEKFENLVVAAVVVSALLMIVASALMFTLHSFAWAVTFAVSFIAIPAFMVVYNCIQNAKNYK